MDPIRYGLIGAGGMGRGHLGCINAIDDIRLTVVAEPCAASRDAFREKNDHSETVYLDDYRELLARDDVDAVVISTPGATHVDIVCDALAAGKHVLSEKPAATSRADLDRLCAAVATADTVYQIGLECRLHPLFTRARKLIADGAIGRPIMLWCLEFRGPFRPKVGHWIHLEDQSGGTFVEKMCHYFDLLTWFAASDPVQVTASAGLDVITEIYGMRPTVNDNGWTLIDYASGARASAGVCMFCEHSPEPIRIGVIGDRGNLELAWGERTRIQLFERATPTVQSIDVRFDPEIEKLSHGGAVHYEHLAFIDAVRTGRSPLCDIAVARSSTLTALAAEESAAAGGTPVRL